MTLTEIIKLRRSVRRFDTKASFDHEAVTRALELAMLAPNSSNLQTWEFYRLKDKSRIAAMVPLCLKQNAARTASELVLFVSRKDHWKARCKWHLDHTLQEIEARPEDHKKLNKSLRYYGTSIPYFYRNDFLGIHTIIRKVNLLIQDIRHHPFIRWTSSSDLRVVSHKSLALAAENFMLSMTDQGYATCPMEGFDHKKVKKFLKLPSEADISMIIACVVGLPEGIYNERRRLPYDQVVFDLG